jgi:GNAT superfamily N-acetyltransferase
MTTSRVGAVDEVTLRPARPAEAEAISELALRSKGYWGYDADFLEACRAELTYTAADCLSGRLVVAEQGDRLLGFYLLGGSAPDGELVALFVDPASIGGGLGRTLLEAALKHAGGLGYASLTLDADPGAEPFYARLGFARVGTARSGSIPGRVLPRMRIRLDGAEAARPSGQAKGSTSRS